MGRRNVIKEKYKSEKARAHEESIQYDSSMQLLNSHLMSKKREKDEHERNKYKFSGLENGRIGRENEGFLEITSKDIDRIYGKSGKSERKSQGKYPAKGKARGKGKGKKKFGGKGKKGGHSFPKMW